MLKPIVPSLVTILVLLPSALIGCNQPRQYKPAARSQTVYAKPTQDSKIVGQLGKMTIRRDDLWIPLFELGGQEIIEEYVLSLTLEQALHAQGLSIVPADIEHEYQLLRTLTTPVDEIVFDNMLEEKGIGPTRKSSLLWRNAALRKLIQTHIEVNDDAVRRMYAIIHGNTYPTRIIVLSTLEEANEVKKKLVDGTSFSDIAIEYSIDSSASRGGRVNAISPADPAWPSPIREAVSLIEVDSVSDPILIGDRWVIVKVTDKPITSNILFDDVEPEMRRLATLAQERFYMEELAQELTQENTLKIIDPDARRILGTNHNRAK